MRLVSSIFTVVVFGITPGTAVAEVHAPTAKGQHHHHAGCNSLACEKRVRAKRTGCYTSACVERVKARQERRRIAHYREQWNDEPYWVRSALGRIAACESHGDPQAISPGGAYRGKYQFSFSTWATVGGRGDPAAASESEQDKRAAMLLRTGGLGHWPVCGANA